MSDYTQKLTPTIRAHLARLLRGTGLPETDESMETLARVWFEKKQSFEEQARALDLQEVRDFEPTDPRGALLLTYSGSLVSLGPLTEGGRRVEYASIKLRTDVPHLLVIEGATLPSRVVQDEAARWSGGPIQSTSPLLKIAVCAPGVSPEEQVRRIREATIFLTNAFTRINRTIAFPASGLPDRYTTGSIVACLARKHGLSQRRTRRLVDDYLGILESGMLLGRRVPLGKLGRLFLRKRPAQKARVGINPATGEEITLRARPEEAVPRMRFSRLMKDRARQVEL